jgi:hypothetical protein
MVKSPVSFYDFHYVFYSIVTSIQSALMSSAMTFRTESFAVR